VFGIRRRCSNIWRKFVRVIVSSQSVGFSKCQCVAAAVARRSWQREAPKGGTQALHLAGAFWRRGEDRCRVAGHGVHKAGLRRLCLDRQPVDPRMPIATLSKSPSPGMTEAQILALRSLTR
jgi:hypothetical protein